MNKERLTYVLVCLSIVIGLVAGFFGIKYPTPPMPEPLPAGDIPVLPDTLAAVDRYWESLYVDKELVSAGSTTVGASIIAEGSTADAYETTLSFTDPTADRTITLPNDGGNIRLWDNAGTAEVNLVFEGATANDYETTLTVTDPTADRTVTLADGSGTVMLSSLATNASDAANAVTGASNALVFEGTANDYETSVTATDPTADRTITLPDASGVPILSSGLPDAAAGLFMSGDDLKFEGSSADDYESMIRFATNPTADQIAAIPASTGYMVLSDGDLQAASAFWGAANALVFEGATANDHETTLAITDPTADRTVTLADGSGTVMLSSLATNAADAANAVTGASNALVFEGATANDFETSLVATDPTADNTVTIPDDTGYLAVFENANTQDQNLVFEGATANDYETTLAITDPTADRTVTLADGSGTVMLSSLATNAADAANAVTGASNALVWEGTANDFETSLVATDPTADNTVTIPDDTGYLAVFENANTQDQNLVFEGATANDYETTLAITDPTADRTVTVPDLAGTVHVNNTAQALTANTGAYSGDVTISAESTGGNEGAKNEYIGLPRIKLVGMGQGTNGTTETTILVDDSPTGEYAPIDADVTEAEGSVTSIYKFGSSSYHALFAATATQDDGFKRTIVGDDLEANESIGLFLYSDTAISSGDLQILLTDDGGARNFNIGAISAGFWTWVEVDISSLAGGTGDTVTEFGVTLTAQGEAALGEFNLYLDVAYKWDSTDEDALSTAILQDGVTSIVDAESGGTLAEGTDYFVHYETGNDFVVWITNQSAADVVALVAY